MKRNTKISCDVSREADNMLKAYCIKHERSKGFLLEKMIRKFCGEVEAAPATQVAVVKKETVKRFVPPTPKEIFDYMREKGVEDVTESYGFNDFYESNGWKVGKNKMKCWKAAVRNWLKGNNNGSTKSTGQKLSAYERTREANSEYRQQQPDEREVVVGADGGHLGRAVDAGEGRATLEHVDTGTFIDYE